MLLMPMLVWWYGRGVSLMVGRARRHLIGVSQLFSVPILVRTLWAPWRRIVAYPGASIDQKLRAVGDNMVSRAVGFTVRFFVLLTAGVMLLLTAGFGLLTIIVWPLVPPLIIGLLVIGALK